MIVELPYHPSSPTLYSRVFLSFSFKCSFFFKSFHWKKGKAAIISTALATSGLAQRFLLLPCPPFRSASCDGKNITRYFLLLYIHLLIETYSFAGEVSLNCKAYFLNRGYLKMEFISFVFQSNLTPLFPSFTCCVKPSFQSKKMDQKVYKLEISRRMGILTAITSVVLAGEGIFSKQIANGFEFGLVAPDQTVEEAESGIRSHAQALLQVKDLLETESWKEAQKALPRSGALLKKDMYTMINSKPGSERP